jgi:hypothetical protein
MESLYASPLTTTLFPIGSMDISCKDDVTVILFLAVPFMVYKYPLGYINGKLSEAWWV